jgi:hypothetical protein
MQTFLPDPSFALTAKYLDNRRLGKQRVEAWQIFWVLSGHVSSWKSHPVMRMWQGYENALLLYYNTMLEEWARRGYRNIILQPRDIAGAVVMPPWLGNKDFHLSHQSNLVRKLPSHYGSLFPGVPNNLPYIWPD